LFEVALDPGQFGRNDREKALVAFTREIMKKEDGRATWIGINPHLPRASFLSTMPVLPRDAEGEVYFDTEAGKKMVEPHEWSNIWWLKNAPKGTIDEQGYLSLVARAKPWDGSVTTNEPWWQSIGDSTREPQALTTSAVPKPAVDQRYAVVVGTEEPYLHGEWSMYINPQNIVLLIVEKHESGKYHVEVMGNTDPASSDGWEYYQLKIGGPRPLES